MSPKYKMELLNSVEKAIWDEYKSYKKVEQYIYQWQEDYNGLGEYNFDIHRKENSEDIDLSKTLSCIYDSLLMQIAVDIGVSTPDFIPIVSKVENIFKVNYATAHETFKKSLERCYEDPDTAVSLANSALESIVKHILSDGTFPELNRKDTLYKLTQSLLKEFSLYPGEAIPKKINSIGSALLNLTQNIEALRSEHTKAHGKLKDDYIVDDPIYAFFIVNTVTTVGLFLISFYEKKYKSEEEQELEEIPF